MVFAPYLRLSTFWFAPMPADRLAVVRLLVGSFSLWYLITRFDMLARIAATDAALYDPVGVAVLLPVPISAGLYAALVAACIALGGAFTLGWRFRWTGPAFALLFLFVMCYRNSWSMVYHSRNLVVLSAVVLALAPSADALSLDALRGPVHKARSWLARRARDRRADAAYGWAVRLLCALTVGAYFLAGVAKIAGDLGWAWAGGNALRDQIVVDALRKDVLGGGTLPPLTALLYDHLWLFGMMGATSLILELGAPLALANRRLGWLWAAATFAMHWGIFLMMGIRFRYQLAGFIFAPFLPVERATAWLRARWQAPIEDPESEPPPLSAVHPNPSFAASYRYPSAAD